MPVTEAKDWLLIVVTGVLLSLIVTWSIVGRVPTIVAGRGVILRPQQVVPVQTMVAGRVISVHRRHSNRTLSVRVQGHPRRRRGKQPKPRRDRRTPFTRKAPRECRR